MFRSEEWSVCSLLCNPISFFIFFNALARRTRIRVTLLNIALWDFFTITGHLGLNSNELLMSSSCQRIYKYWLVFCPFVRIFSSLLYSVDQSSLSLCRNRNCQHHNLLISSGHFEIFYMVVL